MKDNLWTRCVRSFQNWEHLTIFNYDSQDFLKMLRHLPKRFKCGPGDLAVNWGFSGLTKNRWNEVITCHYYKCTLGIIWFELVVLFPDRWTVWYFRVLHDRLHSWGLHVLKICILLLYLYLCILQEFVACTSEYYNETTIIWRGIIPCKIIYMKLFNFAFILFSFLLPLVEVDTFLLTAGSACIRPFDTIIPPKISEKGSNIL